MSSLGLAGFLSQLAMLIPFHSFLVTQIFGRKFAQLGRYLRDLNYLLIDDLILPDVPGSNLLPLAFYDRWLVLF